MKNKALTGIFFILSCFAAMFVLMEFHSNYLLVGGVALLLLISSFLFLNAVFEKKSKEWGSIDAQENPKDLSGSNEVEFQKKVLTYMEKTNKSQTQMLQELKSQKELMKNLEDELSSLAEKQLVQTKMIVKYNKENAKQVALSEKKVVEQAVNELREVMMSGVLVASANEEKAPFVNEMTIPEETIEFVKEEVVVPEEVIELPKEEEVIIPEEVIELPKEEEIIIPEEVIELPKEEEIVMPEEVIELPKEEEIIMPEEVPELPAIDDFDLPILDDIMIPEEKPVAPAPVDSDPNKMMTPDDIAKLLASMGI